ncbi:MAG: ferritin [Candidatus Micrarchaeota archaeon]|nr:ferritin [Candidatus Micrarchaeota archaeon]
MELKKNVEAALNRQITHELEAWHVYLSISAYFETQSLLGMAKWMRKQADEEMKHAMKIFGYINERGGAVRLEALPAPPSSFSSPLSAFEAALAHEQKNTENIEKLADLAEAEGDKATVSFLKWFIDEQVEEEDSARRNVDLAKMCEGSKAALMQLDYMMGKRESSD